MIAKPAAGSSSPASADRLRGPSSPQRVEVPNLMALVKRAHALERPALARRHGGQVGLDVGEPVAVALRKAPTPRREPGRHLDHLGDLTRLDRGLEPVVDRSVASEQIALQRRTADRAAGQHHRLQRVEQQPSLGGGQGRVRQTVARPDVAGVVRGGTDRVRAAHAVRSSLIAWPPLTTLPRRRSRAAARADRAGPPARG